MNVNIENTNAPKYLELVKRINDSHKRRAHVFTFGCQQNEADSERIRGLALSMGYSLSDTPDGCDLIILNTCAIREHAEMKVFSMLGRIKEYKKSNPELIIGLMGCMAAEEQNLDTLKRNFKYVSFTLPPNMLHLLPETVYKALSEGKRSLEPVFDKGDNVENIPTVRTSGHKAWVSVMYGCNNFCSYCIVPYVRGRERSRESATVISECKELIKSGCREITLLGQNVNSYRSDIDFAGLIEKIALIDGDFIIRFMTSHPKDVSDRLIEVMAKYEGKIAPHFHLPLQSGSDRILRAMNRTYSSERFLSVVDKLRAAIPNIALSTDVIVGFPSETEEDFLATLNLLSSVKFDMVYAFKYSPRAGTPAAVMKEQIPLGTKDDRISRLLSMQDEISPEKNKPYEGLDVRVLVDSSSEEDGVTVYKGRTDTNKLVKFTHSSAVSGEFVRVKITKASRFALIGEESK